MQIFLKWLYLIALIVWVGEVVFFSFVVAPAMFRTFPAAEAGRAVGAVFPTYYRLGYVCGAVFLLTSLFLLAGAAARVWWGVNAALALIMLAATLYAGIIIQPRATELRPQIHDPAAPPTVQAEFDRLHRRAVQLNGTVLICGIAASIITATALRP